MTDLIDETLLSQPHEPGDLHVVGLGASAGGITALQQFFARIPPDSNLAFVVILHLSPEHDSKLAEVLQATASVPVTQVTGTTPIRVNHVYVVPPNKSLEIVDDTLTLSEITRLEQRRSPVDVFFRTLADSQGSRSACIVLSGTGPNGSAGLKRVKEYGGLTIAQDPAEAEYPDMPRNAIATGLVDFVMPVAEIPGRVIEYFSRFRRQALAAAVAAGTDQDDALRDVLALLRVRTGQDFSNYKRATLTRRIERRINLHGFETLGSYARYIREQPDEAVALMRELLISVTNFFRDAEAFRILHERAIPRLFQDKRTHDQVRVWVPGCATGEEAYSIAMLLVESAADVVDSPSIQLFATDLDEHAVGVAREGLYTDAEVADVSEDRLHRFFLRESGGYRVRRELRELVLFASHNVIKDPPFSHLDLVSCRNLLIYLNRPIQQRVIETFHFALRPGGYLFLGTSESPDGEDLFVTVDKNAHLYQTRSATSRIPVPIDRPLPAVPMMRIPRLDEAIRPSDRIAPIDLHQRLLEQYAPPSIVVTEEHQVVHVSTGASRFLRVTAGEPTRELLKLIVPELRIDVRTALHQAARQQSSVEVRGVRAGPEPDAPRVTIIVRPVLRDTDPARGYFVVLFDEAGLPEEQPIALDRPSDGASQHLEEELTRVKAQLRATVEQYETQVEEAKAANEELQAMNEELRSGAEELETSKEELQSLNEELTTVNQELKIKIEELGLTNNDFQNLINSTDIGTIFLDRSLRVKLTTPRVLDVFNLLPSDTGRLLSDITTKLLYTGLHDDITSVLAKLVTVEREVETRDGRWFLMRVLPYRTTDDRIDGVVVTFQDVTGRRAAERQALTSQELELKVGKLQTAEREIALLVRRLIENQEEQRGRIARDLHDQLGQQLTALRLVLERHKGQSGACASTMDEALTFARKLDADVDFLAWELRPAMLDELGLTAALPKYVKEWSERYGIRTECRCGRLSPADLTHEAEVVFYRVAQEALNNVVKHAHASRVDVIVEQRDRAILLVVEDDGVGFDISDRELAQRGLGLVGMRERAALVGGELQIESRPGHGTSVYLRAPAGAGGGRT